LAVIVLALTVVPSVGSEEQQSDGGVQCWREGHRRRQRQIYIRARRGMCDYPGSDVPLLRGSTHVQTAELRFYPAEAEDGVVCLSACLLVCVLPAKLTGGRDGTLRCSVLPSIRPAPPPEGFLPRPPTARPPRTLDKATTLATACRIVRHVRDDAAFLQPSPGPSGVEALRASAGGRQITGPSAKPPRNGLGAPTLAATSAASLSSLALFLLHPLHLPSPSPLAL